MNVSYKLSELEFHDLSCEVLKKISNMIEKADVKEILELENYDGILSINTKDYTYLITQHKPSKQIWIASPLRGGLHFSYDFQSKSWLSKKKYELFTIIKQELEELFKIVV